MDIYCPACGGDSPGLLGTLGMLMWFRCCHCGMDFNVNTKTHPEVLDAI